jgi:hypothetical protein
MVPSIEAPRTRLGLFTPVRGRRILGSSSILAAFATMAVAAPRENVWERSKRFDVCGREQGTGASGARGDLRR